MDNEGSLFISRVTTDMRRAVRRVTQYLTAAHGLEANQLHLPEMRFGMYEWFKVIAIKNPTPLAQIFRPGGFNTLVELLRHVVGAGRHTLAALLSSKFSPLYRFRSQQKAEAFVASIENARDRFEETLGDDGVLVLPAATSAAPFQNQEFLFPDSTGMTALFNLFKVPATVCPVMLSWNNLPLCVQVVAKRGNDRICLAVAREIEKHFGGCFDPSTKLQRGL
ncbi:fatty-acid amide hydrolase 2-A [Rhipicephalus sanguineus]|uniref:fatty-acid amide hydrolase 2-A n=1 Tax=Rhipicephalus sanguineus TaxID=34632 RepID=UPI0020C269B2|nr:fatty-acid amide hydrolase 2-A [Rhipicephalus sanguineus]